MKRRISAAVLCVVFVAAFAQAEPSVPADAELPQKPEVHISEDDYAADAPAEPNSPADPNRPADPNDTDQQSYKLAIDPNYVADPNDVVDPNDVDMSLSAGEIMQKSYHQAYYQGNDARIRANMTIVNDRGQKRRREFVLLRHNVPDSNDQKYYAYFYRPADVRDIVYMVHKRHDNDTENQRWLYLPSLDIVKDVTAEDVRTSFVNSNCFYEDITGRNPRADKQELLSVNEKYYIVKNTPKDPEKANFAYFYAYIDKENWLTIKKEYYNSENNLYRVIDIDETQQIDDFIMPRTMIFRDLQNGSHTELIFAQVEYDIELPDIFTERFLRRPPHVAAENS